MADDKERVTIGGLDIPFWDLVWFMVKFAFASIPAIFIIYFFIFLIGWIVGGLNSIFFTATPPA